MIPQLPQDGLLARLRLRLPPFARRAVEAIEHLPAPPAHVRTLTIIAAAVAFVAALTYYGADEFSHRAVDQRAATEASSLAQLTGQLATADAYNTYLEMLRYADEPLLRTKTTPADLRLKAMRQLLFLNTNNLSTLVLADRSGNVLASTDAAATHVLDSIAYEQARATLTPSNTDIVLPDAGGHGYIEFAVPLKDPDGTTWAILLGRADPAVLWKRTLAAAVDGSHNVVLSGDGLYAAGVSDDLLKQPWRGQPLDGGGIRATVAGVRSICGLSPIGNGSQIDRGFTIASCLPSSLVEAEHAQAIGKQGWVTLSGAVLAIACAGGALYFAGRRRPPLLLTGPRDELPPPAEAAPGEPTPSRNLDAPALLEAYERRNERLSEQLREEVRARLLLAAAQADEAYRRLGADAGSDDVLHRAAMDEIEAVRDRELRVLEQEMYPAVVRLGLPNALKSLHRDLAETIDLTLDLDPLADAVAEDGERAPIGLGRRLVLYRFALDGARALAAAGAGEALVRLTRTGDALSLTLDARCDDVSTLDASFETPRLAAEAYGGRLDVRQAEGGGIQVALTFVRSQAA